MGNLSIATKGAGRLLAKAFSWKILIWIVAFIAINAIVLSVQAQNATVGFKYIGEKLVVPTQTLDNQTLQIIQDKGLWNSSSDTFSNIWNMLSFFWDMFNSYYIVYLWIVIFYVVCLKLMFDDSKTVPAVIFAIIIFVLLEISYIMFSNYTLDTKYDMFLPITTVIHLVYAIPYIVQPIADKLGPLANANSTIGNLLH